VRLTLLLSSGTWESLLIGGQLDAEVVLLDQSPALETSRDGQRHFLNTVYDAVVASPNWERTVLVINYDEWGGFFDHVPPTIAPDPRPDLGTGLRGFRVPCLVISPRARRRTIAHGTYDHTSVLKMIEWRFGLQPLTVRDAAANNLAEVLDFEARPDLTHAGVFSVMGHHIKATWGPPDRRGGRAASACSRLGTRSPRRRRGCSPVAVGGEVQAVGVAEQQV